MKRLLLMSLFFVCNVWGMKDPVLSTYYDTFNQNIGKKLMEDREVGYTDFNEIRFLLILNPDEEKNEQLILGKIKYYNANQLHTLSKQLDIWNDNIEPQSEDSYMNIYKNRYRFAKGVVDKKSLIFHIAYL